MSTKRHKNDPNPAITFHGTRLEDFVAVSRLFAQDERIPFEALGLVVYLLSKPPDWQIRFQDLVRRSGKSGYAVRQILGFLRELYYARIEHQMDEHGRMKGSRYVLYGDPRQNPEWQKAQLKKAQTVIEFEPKTETQELEGAELLERLYELFGERPGQIKINNIWGKLTDKDRAEIAAVAEKYVLFNPNPKYRKTLHNWINPKWKSWQETIIDRRHEQPKTSQRPSQPNAGNRHVATGNRNASDFHIT